MLPTNENDPFCTTDHDPASAPAARDVTHEFTPGSSVADAISEAQRQAATQKVPQPVHGSGTVSVPGYEIEAVLGHGGMGVVYKARHLTLKRTVALKMVRAGGSAGPHQLARFRTEAEAAARLQHPNIVQIHEVGEADGSPYCALEFVEGVNLAQKLAGKPMPTREAAKLVEALARAMQLAHSRNVIHRDLKPANILLGEHGTPKITDFGLARQLDSDSGETHAGGVMGTPSYMAPEQASGRAHEAGPAADVYALGAILYECLTGRPPFKGETVGETLDQVRRLEPVPPSHRQTGVPLDLETICLKCLLKEPERRYASAAEMADELVRYQQGEPILARPVGRVERAGRWCRRNPGLALLSGGFVAAVLAGFVTSISFALEAKGERDAANHARDDATRAARDADDARSLADQNADRARTNERLAFDRAYNSDLRLVQQAWANNQFDFARELLERQRPEKTDGVERRGFEWDYWNRRGNLRLLTFAGHIGAVSCVAFSPDGKLVASGGDGDYAERAWNLKIWDAESAREIHSLSGNNGRQVSGLAFSPDGKRLVSTTIRENLARVWDVESGKTLFTLDGHTQYLSSAAWSHDGQHIATGSGDSSVRLWDATTGKERLALRDVNLASVNCVAFSPDSTRIAAGGSGDFALRVWEVATGKKLFTLPGHRGIVRTIAYSPDGKWIASGGHDGRVNIWDGANGMNLRSLEVSAGFVFGVAFSPDSRRLATASNKDAVTLWDVGTGRKLFDFKGQTGRVLGVAFSPDGNRLASSDAERTVAVWDAVAANTAVILSPNGAVQSLALSSDGKRLFGGVEDGRVRVWDPSTGTELRAFGTPPTLDMKTLAVHPTGHQVVTEGSTLVVEVWDPRDGTRLHSERNPALVHSRAAAYSPDGAQFAIAGSDGFVRVWSSADFKQVSRFQGKGEPLGIAYDSQGKYLALRDASGVEVWEVATGLPTAEFSDPTMLIGPVALSPDGLHVASGNQSGIVTIWDLKTQRPVRRLTGHTETVSGLAYSPDGKRLASCSHDRTVKVWDPVAGEELLTLAGDAGPFHCVAFSPDGKYLFAGDQGGIRRWEGLR